jgi:hypothetical protein
LWQNPFSAKNSALNQVGAILYSYLEIEATVAKNTPPADNNGNLLVLAPVVEFEFKNFRKDVGVEKRFIH